MASCDPYLENIDTLGNLYDEITLIETEEKTNGSKIINLIKKNKFKKLFLKINDFIELKVVLQYEYPKVSPNLIQILFSKIENLDTDNDEKVDEFFKLANLSLNATVDGNRGKCCVYTIYQQLKDTAAMHKEIYQYLKKIETFSASDDKDDLIQELINKKLEQKNAKNSKKSKNSEAVVEAEKVKFKGSDVIFQRIKWDQSIDKSQVIIGYLDRFKGVMEIPFNDFKGVHEDYREGIPLHRIRHYKINNKIVWDRENRIDLLTRHETAGYFKPSNETATESTLCEAVDELTVDDSSLNGIILKCDESNSKWNEVNQSTQNPSKTSLKQLKILTYNILSTGNFKLSIKYAKEHGASGMDAIVLLDRLSKILECIEKSDAHIIALQECDVDAEDAIRRSAVIKKKYFICSSNSLNNETNCVILTKLPPVWFKLLRLQDKSTKYALILKFKVSSNETEEVYFSNVHLTSDKAANACLKRRAQLQILTDFMFALNKRNENVAHFICGDFNTGDAAVEDQETIKKCLTEKDFVDLVPNFETFNPQVNFTAAITSASQKARRFDRVYMRNPSNNAYKISSKKLLNTSPLVFKDVQRVRYKPYDWIESYCPKDIIDLDVDDLNGQLVDTDSSKFYLHPSDHYALEILIDFKTSNEKPVSTIKSIESVSSKGSNYQSALAIIAPKYAAKMIQEIREKYDRTFNRWPPHINLLYPFCETLDLQSVAFDLSRVLSNYEPFCVNLNKINHFSSNCVVYLEPDKQAEAKIERIQKDIRNYFSGVLPNLKTNFTAHMTIAQPEQRRDVGKDWSIEMMKTITEKYGNTFSTEFTIDAVYWITRSGANDPFRVQHAFPFGKNYPAIQYGLNLEPPTSGIIGFLKDKDCLCVSDELSQNSERLISSIYSALDKVNGEDSKQDVKNCETFQPYYYKVLPIGSYRFGIRFHDIDLVILKQKSKAKIPHNLFEMQNEEFTKEFSQMLAQDQDVFYIARAIADANIPIIEITLNETSKTFKQLIEKNVHMVDIQVYQIPNDDRFFLGKGFLKSYQEYMKEFASAIKYDYNELYPLSAIFESDSIKTHVKNYKDFQLLLSFVKYWAESRSVYGKAFGYLGGISYAILCAYFLKKQGNDFDHVLEVDNNSNTRLLDILIKFFGFYSSFSWHKEIVSLVDMDVVDKDIMRFYEFKDRTAVNVLQSVYPYFNTTHNLKENSKKIIVNELQRAQKLIDEYQTKYKSDLYSNESLVYELCGKLCEKYKLEEDGITMCIRFEVNYQVEDDVHHIFSIMKSRTQGLVYNLERLSKGDFSMRVLPDLEIMPKDSTKKYDNLAQFKIGIYSINNKISKGRQMDINALCKTLCDNVKSMSYTSQFEINYILNLE